MLDGQPLGEYPELSPLQRNFSLDEVEAMWRRDRLSALGPYFPVVERF